MSAENQSKQGYAEAVKSYKRDSTSSEVPHRDPELSSHVTSGEKKNPSNSESEVVKQSSKEKNKGEWILVESLKRKKIKPLVGARQEQSSLCGVPSKKRDSWDLYIGNLQMNTTELQITSYMKSSGVDVVKCLMLSSKKEGTKSARITIPSESKTVVFDSSFWPENVKVRSWVSFPISAVSDRVVAVQLLTSLGTVLVIAVYMPVDYGDAEQWMTTLLNLVTSVGC